MPPDLYVVEGLTVTAQLPSYDEARIPEEKIAYTLSFDSKEGIGPHAVLFQRVLAIESEHAGYLYEQLTQGLPESPAIFHGETQWGPTWEVPVLVTGRNDRVCIVTTGWIIEPEAPAPRFLTARVAKRERVPKLRAIRASFGYATGTT